jgi:hypothetical protein
MQARQAVVFATILSLLLVVGGCSRTSTQATSLTNNAGQPAQSQAVPQSTAKTGDLASSAPATNSSSRGEKPSPSSPVVEPVIIPAGASITVRLQQSLSSKSAVPGQHFEAVIDEPVVIDDRTILPAGALVSGHVVAVHRSGRLHHPGEIALTLDTVTVGDRQVPIATSNVLARGGSHKKRNWSWIGGGAGGGAVIGALAAGGKGALIGSGIGAAAGTTTAFVTGKKEAGFAAERRLRFRLNRNVSVA